MDKTIRYVERLVCPNCEHWEDPAKFDGTKCPQCGEELKVKHFLSGEAKPHS